MNRFILALFALVSVLFASAQDIIVKNDGSTVMCKIVEVNNSEVVYLKWSNINGPRYIMDRSMVANINYQDGRQDKINEQSSNAYAPGNQQTGRSNYNDNTLLALDRSRMTHYDPNKAKTLTTVGWTVGPILTLGGVFSIIYADSNGHDYYESMTYIGAILCAGGIATTTVCLIKANQLKKKSHEMGSAPIYEHDFNFSNGSKLTAGVNLIRDHGLKQSAFGLGFKYNF